MFPRNASGSRRYRAPLVVTGRAFFVDAAANTNPKAVTAMRLTQTNQDEPGKPRFKSFDFSAMHPDQSLTEEMVCAFLCLSRSTVRKKIKA